MAFVLALAKLHNYCIDENQTIEEMLAEDLGNLKLYGAIPIVVVVEADVLIPNQLLGGGNYFGGMEHNERRWHQCCSNNITLPRE